MRTMSVSIGGSRSKACGVVSGVPQGSVLGPLLFLIYVNHLPTFVLCRWSLFADDLKLYFSSTHDSYEEDIVLFQNDIDHLVRVATSWGLSFASHKCARIRFSRPSTRLPPPAPVYVSDYLLECVDSHRDLGVTVDSSLKFHLHIQSIVAKASGVANSLLCSTINRSADFMKNVFISHVRPLLEFSSSLWNTGFIQDLSSIESVQRKWTKRVVGLYELSYDERLRRLGLYSMRGRIIRQDLIQIWKIMHGKSPLLTHLFVLQDSSTRGHNFKIFKPRFNTDIRKRFFSIRTIEIWNSLSHNVVAAPS